ncbi:glycerol-3-phosphate acyltransferase [Lactobacillus ultunensis]|uniref:Glycerol-3-phosphate acyltransferase n=1 Tax=Lactobacillus ultunensis DSM 16047 TaxID=525365 RepID=C2EPW6_9LACO|nr:glycerol-3-phosphate acyltransferase [Lactobacillus ultunensis]EEJ71415.1 putative acyl-phosphate glycerol 3-phosphate acyltransferase [Lactobacillus ultunensis DSM 16047]KRL80118.1 glycerol-3-phosphate acyltransferase PlsY [Lactobacillus ultunensis DSM 16047]
MNRIYAILIGYVFGNFLTAMIVGEIFLKINPTEYGSHNPGTANMGAVFGKKWGILTCCGDLLKSLIALFIVYFAFPAHINIAYTGLGLILGHCFPIWDHFKGGKGVAVAAQVAVFYDWRVGFATLLVALVLTAIMQNLTIPPLVFMLLFSIDEFLHSQMAGVVFVVITLIMVFKFWQDIVDFFTGHGKRVDILFSIKKKLGIKVK